MLTESPDRTCLSVECVQDFLPVLPVFHMFGFEFSVLSLDLCSSFIFKRDFLCFALHMISSCFFNFHRSPASFLTYYLLQSFSRSFSVYIWLAWLLLLSCHLLLCCRNLFSDTLRSWAVFHRLKKCKSLKSAKWTLNLIWLQKGWKYGKIYTILPFF